MDDTDYILLAVDAYLRARHLLYAHSGVPQVTVHYDNGVTLRMVKAGRYGDLVAKVASKRKHRNAVILAYQSIETRQGSIYAAVINEDEIVRNPQRSNYFYHSLVE